MHYESRSQNNPDFWRIAFLLTVIGVALFSIFRISSAAPTAPQQDAIRLENRLSQVEQRMYAIESNLRTIEQQSRSSLGFSRCQRGGSIIAKFTSADSAEPLGGSPMWLDKTR